MLWHKSKSDNRIELRTLFMGIFLKRSPHSRVEHINRKAKSDFSFVRSYALVESRDSQPALDSAIAIAITNQMAAPRLLFHHPFFVISEISVPGTRLLLFGGP